MVTIAVILMVGSLGIGMLVLLTVIACDVRRGVGIGAEILRAIDGRAPGDSVPVVPRYPPFKPGECAADARAFAERQAKIDPTFGAFEPVEVTRDDTPIPPSLSPDTLVELRAMHRTAMEVPPYRPTPALGEDEDDGPRWMHESGTWTKGEGR